MTNNGDDGSKKLQALSCAWRGYTTIVTEKDSTSVPFKGRQANAEPQPTLTLTLSLREREFYGIFTMVDVDLALFNSFASVTKEPESSTTITK